MSKKAIFFDRDDTLILNKHYMHKVEEIEYYPDTFSALKEIQELGFEIYMITNQSGIGRGYFKVEDMHKVHEQMIIDFKEHGIEIKDIEFCPHAPDDNCECRKPKTLMLERLIKKYDIDIKNSYMIGDKEIDALTIDTLGGEGHLVHAENENFPAHKQLSDFVDYLRK